MAKVEYLDGVINVFHDKYTDSRGELYTLWKSEELPSLNFNHDKIAKSQSNVLRGLHTDKSWKLISCIYGKIQLVVVNFDKNSNDYLNWTDFILDSNSDDMQSVLVPPGFLNGHLVLSNEAIFHYKWCYEGDYPDVKDQLSVRWNDPALSVDWLCENPILSERDQNTHLL
jgi:dTDP-4-dehydrorhamnose 3,5-epimerase